MQLSELAGYAREKYQMEEEHKWADFPGFSVLCHPRTRKWVALLMRQWDSETGEEIERCDLKCGDMCPKTSEKPYLSPPVRMKGSSWIGIVFDRRTEPDYVFHLLDEAVAYGSPAGCTIILSPLPSGGEDRYRDTPLPFAGSTYRPRGATPERLRKMLHLYEYGGLTARSRAENFLRQARFMEDFEDDVPWSGDFACSFPTYHEMTTRQLRGYFTWRALVRRSEWQQVPVSVATIYLFELLNGVGTASPEDGLEKLRAFEVHYLDAGMGTPKLRGQLHRWMLDFAILRGLPPETARSFMDPKALRYDNALAVLEDPGTHTDEELFGAFTDLGGIRGRSPVLEREPERGMHLFCEAWRRACADREEEREAFGKCFGIKKVLPWHPMYDAVFFEEEGGDREYALGSRVYRRRNGAWTVEAYEKNAFDGARFKGFLHQADALFRRYLRTGRYLKEAPADAWANPWIEAVIQADRKAVLEAERPKITIDFTGLDRIRQDAAVTRESLLTEEEREPFEEVEAVDTAAAEEPDMPDLPLDGVQRRILSALLEGGDASDLLRESRRMASVEADAINEALFEEFGDSVVLCEEGVLSLAEDYIEDLKEYLGGTTIG